MTQKKAAHPKKQKARKEPEAHAGDDETVVPPALAKSKKPLELDVVEAVIGIDEKIEPEVPVADETSEEGATEELGIDDEELDPFGDKWEQ